MTTRKRVASTRRDISTGRGRTMRNGGGSRAGWSAVGLVLAMGLWLMPATSLGQGTLGKLPGHNKLHGSRQQAFSGAVQSLNRKLKVLNVTTHHGRDTQIFPIRSRTRVETLDGKRLTLKSLVPGTNVLIYYSEHGGQRSIQQVIVLESPPGKKKTLAKRRS